MRNLKGQFVSSLILVSMILVGCGKQAQDTGTAKLKFSNTQNSPLGLMNQISEFFTQKAFAATVSTPTEFKMKLIAAYLSSDIDPKTGNNIGEDAMVYINPECQNDLTHCDVSGGTAVDGKPYSKVVNTEFDFGGTSDQVNAALNAQGLAIPTGQYKYVRLEFCKINEEKAHNVTWQGGMNNTETSFTSSACNVNSVVLDPPLSIAKGEAATIHLTYDYSSAISVGADARGDNCVGSGDTTTCFTVPTFVPSASK